MACQAGRRRRPAPSSRAGPSSGAASASTRTYLRPFPPAGFRAIPASVKKTFLRRRKPLGRAAFGAPNQGEDRSFCCWITGQGFAQKECLFHRHRLQLHGHPSLPTALHDAPWRFALPLSKHVLWLRGSARRIMPYAGFDTTTTIESPLYIFMIPYLMSLHWVCKRLDRTNRKCMTRFRNLSLHPGTDSPR